MFNSDRQLGQILVMQGKLDADDLELALREHHKTGERLDSILLKMGLASEEDVLRALAEQLQLPFVRLSEHTIPKDVIEKIPAKLVSHYHLVPIEQTNGTLRVAVSDPLDIHTLDDLRMILKVEVEPVVATYKDIEDAIKRYYGIGAATVEELMEESGGETTIEVDRTIEDIDEMAEDASIVRFVNQIIAEAIADRATDIHVEPFEQELRIRYRIDGMLYEAAIPPSIKRFQSAIISRIKIMADMNIAERRLPQDGKIKVKVQEKDFDLRVSTLPTPYGESISIRILSRESELVSLDKLGLDEYHLKILRRMIQKPHGIIFVTGPTGSGKSTTLYAALREINTIDKKILTVEDPIEYRIPGVTQVQVNPQIDLTFARVLRTMLRQDPDVIMVGETRDPETAQAAIRAALTGHLVFSTLHTNDAAGAVSRLLDMGIEPFLVASSVEGLIAQRLVRVLCPDCKVPYTPTPEVLARLKVNRLDVTDATLMRPAGCERCRYTGFRGRTAIYEIIKVTEDLKQMIVARRPSNEIKQQAIANGMRTIREDGWLKVRAGLTTIDEVLRVTMEDEFGGVTYDD
ncbi:MAG: type II secretion system protein GspE [Candidatus Sumerlaea sp.]|uniref:protein-secreting ATPase n=1 Tax=Sumerlaea chitinivorans TaxID=2250252 RepID=A0A2Z4Y6T1_SUMC1|nr:Type IV fimbrial assembly, ATPase PilB [Candidatus Sumerlaea chitinivorans]MCX7964577.1 type II secretion system ATPase GspE [Candidatus Sumerlaea chitinivorans]GIX45738.1 MAG: type II secretion system protein GspE [Candidatus Sumerlaea sp.]